LFPAGNVKAHKITEQHWSRESIAVRDQQNKIKLAALNAASSLFKAAAQRQSEKDFMICL